MAWTTERDAQGRTIWAGQNGIYNMEKEHHATQRTGDIGCTVALLVGGLIVLTMLVSAMGADFGGGSRRDKLDNTPLLFLLAFVAICGAAWMIHYASLKEWVGGSWQMICDGGTLTFSGPKQWAVPVDQIASVEAGRTVDWQMVRDYGGSEARLIPDVEWQTFLVLTDQTRRVVHYANADREGCAALAASIRSHVEAARSSAPSLPSSAAPAGDGFDL